MKNLTWSSRQDYEIVDIKNSYGFVYKKSIITIIEREKIQLFRGKIVFVTTFNFFLLIFEFMLGRREKIQLFCEKIVFVTTFNFLLLIFEFMLGKRILLGLVFVSVP